jgi:hypothetical protein
MPLDLSSDLLDHTSASTFLCIAFDLSFEALGHLALLVPVVHPYRLVVAVET